MVTRIIVSRCEVDLKKVCSEYKTNFGQSLQKTIMVSGSHSLPLAYSWFTLRLVLSCSPSNLLCFCRNTPRETTRRCCSACVDQRSKNESSVSKGPHFAPLEMCTGKVGSWISNSAAKPHPTFSTHTFECNIQGDKFIFFLHEESVFRYYFCYTKTAINLLCWSIVPYFACIPPSLYLVDVCIDHH